MVKERLRQKTTVPEHYRIDNAKYSDEAGWLVNSILALKNKKVLPINDTNAKDPTNIDQAKQSKYWDL